MSRNFSFRATWKPECFADVNRIYMQKLHLTIKRPTTNHSWQPMAATLTVGWSGNLRWSGNRWSGNGLHKFARHPAYFHKAAEIAGFLKKAIRAKPQTTLAIFRRIG
jgi:hypothetical protein